MKKTSKAEQTDFVQNFNKISPDTICSDYSKFPLSKLSTELVKEMISGYKKHHLKMINEGVLEGKRMYERIHDVEAKDKKFDDAHSIWFDCEELQLFLYHIIAKTRKYAKSLDMKISLKDLGIRFHYAKYPDACNWAKYRDLDEVPEEYRNRHTLVMIPTIREGNINRNFDIDNPETYKPKHHKAGFSYTDFGDFMSTAPLFRPILNNSVDEDDEEVTSRNHGSLIPPGKETDSGS